MPVLGSLSLVDAYGRGTTRSYEMVDAVLADAQTDLTAIRTALTALSDMGYTAENLTDQTALTVAAQTGANVDVGATFRVRLDNGKIGNVKIPAIKDAKVNADGSIDPADTEVVAFFTLLGLDEPTTPAVATIYNGRKVTSVLSGTLDK